MIKILINIKTTPKHPLKRKKTGPIDNSGKIHRHKWVNHFSAISFVLEFLLFFTSAANIQNHLKLYFFLEANYMNHDQSAPLSLILVHIVCYIGYVRT